jgi:hypothetical protein
VREGKRQGTDARGQRVSLHDPPGVRAGQQRAHGEAQLVEPARAGDMAEQVRPALDEDAAVAALGQPVQRDRAIDHRLARDQHVGGARRRGPPRRWSQFGGDDDGPGGPR